jgi:hypothetical protein
VYKHFSAGRSKYKHYNQNGSVLGFSVLYVKEELNIFNDFMPGL